MPDRTSFHFPPLSSLMQTSPMLQVCDESYLLVAGAVASLQSCKQCQAAFECPRNSSLASVFVKQGWWRLSPYAQQAYKCPGGLNTTACSGGVTAANLGQDCEEEHPNSTALHRSRMLDSP